MLDKEMQDYIRQEIEATLRSMQRDIQKLSKYPDKELNAAKNIVHSQGYIHALKSILYVFGAIPDEVFHKAENTGGA